MINGSFEECESMSAGKFPPRSNRMTRTITMRPSLTMFLWCYGFFNE